MPVPVRFTARSALSRLLALLLLGHLTLVLGGCEMPAMPWDNPKPDSAHEEEAAGAESEADAGEESETEPLDMSKLLPPAMRDLPYEEVNIPMADRLALYGRLYDPAMARDEDGETVIPALEAEEYAGPRYPLVVLVHGLNGSQASWHDLPATLVKAGYAVFAVDLRGHGQSTRTSGGRRVSWRMMQAGDWPATHEDIGRVIRYFKQGDDYPQVDGAKVAVIGEKLGANVAAFAANRQHAQALVLISPGLNYKGLDATRGLLNYTHPTLMLTSRDEKEAYTAAQHLFNWITGPKTLYEYQQSGQGADMLIKKPAIGSQIRDWLVKNIPPMPPAAEASEAETEAHDSGSSG